MGTPAIAEPTAQKRYVPRGHNDLHTIFERHFADFCEHYDEKYAATYGKYRLERIQQIGHRFCICGDDLQGVARIRCRNPECGHDYFRPFSCKGFYLCPSCSRKRTILFAEHLTNEVLLKLPHRQFVFTMPRALRPFFHHDRRLFGDMLRFNPHFHAIVLEGGCCSTLHTRSTSDQRLRWSRTVHMFDALGFLAGLTQHIPPKRLQLIRCYGLYAARTKGRWQEMPWVAERAPEGWKTSNQNSAGSNDVGYDSLSDDACEVTVDARKHAWARFLAKVYEVDPMVCPKCGEDMKVIAVIEDPNELKRILRHLVKIGRSPPGFDPDRLD